MTTTASFDPARARIAELLVERSIPSIAVAVAKGGEILWEEGFGWADRENRVLATAHTTYSLASISTPITTTGLMVLVEAGKVDLDRPIDDYLGAAKLAARVGDAREATVRRVADHSAGLPLHYQFFYEDEPYRRPAMDDTILRYANLFTAPGERYQYSNLGYGLLDHVIARVSGRSYPEFMRREVFLPLGMTRSSIDVGPGLEANQAVRYDLDGTPIPFYDFDHPGGSAVYASAHDLVRFGMFHLKDHLADQRAILRDDTIDEMHRPTAGDGPVKSYGIGWLTAERGGHRVVSHSGGMPGVATILDLVPDEDLAVVVLCNVSDHDSVPLIRDAIMAAVLPDWPAVPVPVEEPPSPGDLAQLTGVWEGAVQTYVEDLPLRIEVLPDGHVHVRLGDQLTTLLNDARFSGGRLTGVTTGDIRTPDANRRPSYRLRLELDRLGDRLAGAVVATTDAPRMFAISHWAELTATG